MKVAAGGKILKPDAAGKEGSGGDSNTLTALRSLRYSSPADCFLINIFY
jgi:hypothetical protein